MPDFLAFDIGNTSVKGAAFVAGSWQPLFGVPTIPIAGLKSRIEDKLPTVSEETLPHDRCIASSVCPGADAGVRAFWAQWGGGGPVEFFGRDLAIPLPNMTTEPEKVGTDRLLAALGAKTLYGAPCIIISAGTAITVDLVDERGQFAGGSIAPGFYLAAHVLHQKTAALPLVKPAARPRVPAKNTEDALRAGVYWSCAGGVQAILAELRKDRALAEARVVCTGTDSPLLLPVLPEAAHEPHLIFKGMAVVLEAEAR